MKHKMKRLFAWVLTAVMLLTMIPITASAADAAEMPTEIVNIDVGGEVVETDTYKIQKESIYLKSADVTYVLTGTTDRRIYMNGSVVPTVHLRLNGVTTGKIYYSSNYAGIVIEVAEGTTNTINGLMAVASVSIFGNGTLNCGYIFMQASGFAEESITICDTTVVADNINAPSYSQWVGPATLSGTAHVTITAQSGCSALRMGDSYQIDSPLTLTDTAQLILRENSELIENVNGDDGLYIYGSIELRDSSKLIAEGGSTLRSSEEQYARAGSAIFFGHMTKNTTLTVGENAYVELIGGTYSNNRAAWATNGWRRPSIHNAGFIKGNLVAKDITNTSTGFILGQINATGTVSNDHIITKAIYSVSYAANGGSGTMADAVAYDGSPYTSAANAFTAPEGMRFKGWAIGSSEGTQIEAGESVNLTANTTLYAVWEDIPPTHYMVSFAANGGTGAMDAMPVLVGSPFVLPEPGFTAPEGMQFVGWSTGDDVTHAIGDSMTPTANTTLTAVWEPIPVEPQNTTLWLPVLARLYNTTLPITAIAGEGGSISDGGVVQVKYGRNATYTITPDEGYIIADVLVNGKSVGAVSEYTFTKVRRAQVIEAIFAVDPDAVPVEVPVDDPADPMYSYDNP